MITYWYAIVMYPPKAMTQEQQLGFSLMLLPTTTIDPKIPEGAKLLGRPKANRAEVLTSMMDYIASEKTVHMFGDALKGRG